jgi:Tol biopolymer transport system component/tetratricopeptide (TPR) repeat protein
LNESLPGRIFISYRRQETAWPAGRLYDVLVEHFPSEQVFKDVDNIDPGEDFVERITAAVESCDVLLALIGPQWLTITNKKGQRRLDDPEDYVRLEIETALTRKIRVIPILVDEAQMPGADELPPILAPLVRRNAVEINPMTFDTKRLIATVQKTLTALKNSDIATGSAAPRSTAKPDRVNQQVAGPEIDQLYDEALAAFWTEQWDKAVDLLGQVVSRQPDYADAARKLEAARQKQQLASHYAQATAAADAGNWEEVVAEYTIITDTDPNYRDTNARLAEARHQQQLASLLAEAHRLHRAGQWAAVIKVGEQLQALDPALADPEGRITSARTELAAEQRAAELAADYHTGLHLFDEGRWKEAIEALKRVTQLDPTYQDTPALLDRARRELEQAAAALAEERARQEAAEQAGSPTSKSGGRRRVALILTAAVVVAGILGVAAVNLWPKPTGPTSAEPSSSNTGAASSPSSPPATKTPVPPLPRSRPLPDTQLLVPVLVDGKYDIYLGDVTKNAPVRALIKDPGDDTNVTLSPDRASMIYLHEGVPQVAAADGTGSHPLFSSVPKQCAESKTRMGWNSADPSQIAIACVDADGKAGVYLVTIDGKVIRKLSEGDYRVGDPGFSPDGKFVVFWANKGLLGDPGFDGGDIVVASSDGKGKPRRVTRMTDTVYDADPAWSPKGDQIAFRRRDRTGDRKNSDVYVIDADGKSEAKPLADDPNADEQNPSWSPSGDQIAYKSKAKTAAWPDPPVDRVWVMNSNGTNQRVLWTSGSAAVGAQIAPSWSSR